MQCMVDGSFSMDDAAEDFMFLSLFRLEIAQGVYTTPPQLVLSLRRRLDLLTNSKDIARGMQILHRLDNIWRTWRLCWITRPFGNCRIGIEGMADRDEAHRLKTTAPQKLLTDRFVCGAGDIEDEDGEAPSTNEKLLITQAVELCLQSPDAYPCFIVKSPLGSLNLTDTYYISFRKLGSKLDIGASTSRVVFVRNWAIPFTNVPPRFTVPTLDAKSESASQTPVKKPKKAPMLDPPPTKGVYWTGTPLEGATANRKYYQSVIANGLEFAVGSDVIINEPAQKKSATAKYLVDNRTIGRLISLYESSKDRAKYAVIRQWISPRTAKRKLSKDQKNEAFKDWEILASNSLKTVSVDRLAFLLQVKSPPISGKLTLPIIVDQPVDDVYDNSQTLMDLSPCDSDTWQMGTIKGGVPILKLICTRLFAQNKLSALPPARITPPPGSEISAGSKSVVELDFKKPSIRDTPTPTSNLRKISLRGRSTPTPGVKSEPVKSEATPPPLSGGSTSTPPPLDVSQIISASGTLPPSNTISLRQSRSQPANRDNGAAIGNEKEKRLSENPSDQPRKVLKLRPTR
eukprot:TRINITY_DN3597_c0_g1_i3.p1 TRINITY_DN3597_c0_g1~~TRINITY_DN3597_c0_g1_i3.p1  ORF type:complete len:572 (+),score=80.65 TRINITY_DN3597_c0_g1_i3:79-1794(+)